MERVRARMASMFVLLLLFVSHGVHGTRMLQGELPPCKDVPGGIPGWDCFDPPTHDLPPCDFHHQRPGFDCWPKSPPNAKMTSPQRVEDELPPCKDVPGGIQNWDCVDNPMTPLPLCDFHHQRPGFDCWPNSASDARP